MAADESIDGRLARRLRELRQARGWSLDALARRSGVSRASLSRLENAETSATASVLGRLCAAHGLPVSRLMAMVEDDFPALVAAAAQPVWTDPQTGFRRRAVSPPGPGLAGAAIEGTLPAGRRIDYPLPPRAGLEHHLVLLEGALRLALGDCVHVLSAGDCLRYRLDGPSRFETPPGTGARYLLFTA